MKAIIMAGGQGTRLRPVSGPIPKPMIRILGRPAIDHILFLLRRHGIREVCVTLRYQPEQILDHLGDGSAFGLSLDYHIEKEPLGTAGGVKACEGFYGEEDFLVISGDAACDFDLSRLMQAHRDWGAAATMALYPTPRPISYGLVLTDKDNHIRRFIEKPAWPQVVTNLVNTGIYVLSPRAMAAVPPGTPYDFAKDLFPDLLAADMPLYGLPMSGYWCDIGTPEAYYRCCLDALSGALHLIHPWGQDVPPAPAGLKGAERAPLGAGAATQTLPTQDRAALMHALSDTLAEFGADFTDGLQLTTPEGKVRFSPLPEEEAICTRPRAAVRRRWPGNTGIWPGNWIHILNNPTTAPVFPASLCIFIQKICVKMNFLLILPPGCTIIAREQFVTARRRHL